MLARDLAQPQLLSRIESPPHSYCVVDVRGAIFPYGHRFQKRRGGDGAEGSRCSGCACAAPRMANSSVKFRHSLTQRSVARSTPLSGPEFKASTARRARSPMQRQPKRQDNKGRSFAFVAFENAEAGRLRIFTLYSVFPEPVTGVGCFAQGSEL